jgi:hypothetical protein
MRQASRIAGGAGWEAGTSRSGPAGPSRSRSHARAGRRGRHAPPALRGPVGALVELASLLAAWLVSLRTVPRHARRVRLGGHWWPLRTVLLVAAGVAVLLVFAAAGAYVIGGGLIRVLGYLLAGRL